MEGGALQCADRSIVGLVGEGVVRAQLQEDLLDGRIRLEGLLHADGTDIQ